MNVTTPPAGPMRPAFIPIACPTPTLAASARTIVTTPEGNHPPTLRALAWHTLANTRGIRTNLGRMTALAIAASRQEGAQ